MKRISSFSNIQRESSLLQSASVPHQMAFSVLPRIRLLYTFSPVTARIPNVQSSVLQQTRANHLNVIDFRVYNIIHCFTCFTLNIYTIILILLLYFFQARMHRENASLSSILKSTVARRERCRIRASRLTMNATSCTAR